MRRKKRHVNKGHNCTMDGCIREANVGGLCKCCYVYMRYWRERSPGDVVARMQQIQLWETRLGMFVPSVKTVSKRRKRRKAA